MDRRPCEIRDQLPTRVRCQTPFQQGTAHVSGVAGRPPRCHGRRSFRTLCLEDDRRLRRRLPPRMILAVLIALVFGPMLIEARRAARHERLQLSRGGIEPAGDVYEVMRLAYPGA